MNTKITSKWVPVMVGGLVALIPLSLKKPAAPAATETQPTVNVEQQHDAKRSESALLRAQSTRPASTLVVHEKVQEAPSWSVPYGGEFWRKGVAKPPAEAGTRNAHAPFNLGDIIARVSHAITRTNSSELPRVEAAAYTARFDGNGVRFLPKVPRRDDAEETHASDTEAVFQTISLRRGNNSFYAGVESARAWSVLGNTAQALITPAAGVVEHYETRQEGVAVTWVMRQPLPGSGPLRIQAQFTGLSYAGQTEEGHHYAEATGTARVRVGNATAVDSTGTTWPVPVEAAGDQLSITVPEVILSQATYPLAIDPVVGPEFGMDKPVGFPQSRNQSSPAMAFNGNVYLVVWQDDRNNSSGNDIYGCRVSTDGLPIELGGIAISTQEQEQTSPAVAANGPDFLVVWEDSRNSNTGRDIYGARLRGDGAVIETRGLEISISEDNQWAPAVASNGTNYLVVWHDMRNSSTMADIYGALVTRDGGVAGRLNGIEICRAPQLYWFSVNVPFGIEA